MNLRAELDGGSGFQPRLKWQTQHMISWLEDILKRLTPLHPDGIAR